MCFYFRVFYLNKKYAEWNRQNVGIHILLLDVMVAGLFMRGILHLQKICWRLSVMTEVIVRLQLGKNIFHEM